MSRRAAGADNGEVRGENAQSYTYGHNLLTPENVQKLADQANYWAVILKFENNEEAPAHGLFPKAGLMGLYEQNRLCRATMLAGFKTTRSPKRPVPACFFRTLDFLLQYVAAGNSYRAITDKEEAKGFPPAAWCRPPVVSAREEAEVMTAVALEGAPPVALARAPATDPIRLFYASRSWCIIHQFATTAASARVTVGVSPAEVYGMYCDGALSEYLPMLGLVEEAPAANTWAPPCVMVPLGALLYMHEHGRPYLPLTLSELREVRNNGIMSVAVRPDARPMRLPPGVWPAPEHSTGAAALPPGMEQHPAAASTAGAAAGPSASGRGAGGAAAAAGTRSQQRPDAGPTVTAAAAAAGGRQAGGAAAATAAAAGRGAGGVAGSSPARGNGVAETAPPAPEPEPDPILNSANWIMPQPFNTPIPPPPPEASEPPPAAAPADADAAGGAATANGVADAAGAGSGAAGLPPSPFLQSNDGLQPTFETPALRLFLGERGQAGLSANWWYVDGETNAIKGPYSPEAMLLSCITPCCEVHDETLVCGTEADVRLPMVPPRAAFLPLGELMGEVLGGSYALVSRVEIVSPLARSFLANRIRQPKQPVALAPAPGSAPVVIAVQAQAQPQQQQQPQPPQLQQLQLQTALSGAAAALGTAATAGQLSPVSVVQVVAPSPPPPQQQQQQQQQPAAHSVLQPPFQPQQQHQQPQQYQQAPQHQQQQQPQYQQQQPQQQQPQYQQQQAQQHQQPQYQQQQAQQQQQAPVFPAQGGAVRGMLLPPHLMAARPHPVAAVGVGGGGMPVPAYTLPGSAVYLPQYGQPVPHGGQAVMAQPVLRGNVQIVQQHHTAPAQMGQQQQQQ
ncbi:hypothetical protein PLESTB_001204000 [Pleodorina starrii]|uniref:Uncharacterized protein n=1 Tax=Pleodorina starrii TaxID=330485 RepID=A0A9W6F5I5_9CHLO|nr:hypothetical protein PLESTM_001746900 [Pleodorina starrii]GLC57252.1 hypothetical protein PLESTB_001204000 [Pleodorina starrii]GLC71358.1 hypothetical protein PLESTF_001106900 [Pleodorina starrii]